METRSRKRAEASSSSQQQKSPSTTSVSTRSSKRARVSSTSAVVPEPVVSIRSRLRSNSNNTSNQIPMDLHDSPAPKRESEGTGRRRRSNRDKGKEKEDVEGSRSRDRDRERDLEAEKRDAMGTSAADNDNDNDNNSEDGTGAGLLHHNFTSASSALQGLLRKLGAGLDDLLPSSALSGSSGSHQSSRLKKMLAGLRADGEEGKQVEALTQLCEMLSIGTEDSLGSFSVDSFVPVLVGLLNHESNPDIMLLAARALTHLCDVLPSLCSAVVHYGAVTCFVARLLTIEYMDLAEQSLQAIKKISQEHPTACLRAGALMAVLSYLDFFSTGVQRVALSTAANMCKKLPSDAADFVMEAVPLLTNLLNYHDSKVLDHASVCLTRITEAFASSPDKLDELCNHGLVAQAAGLISTSNTGGGQASLSTPTCTGLIRLLSTCASGSVLGAKTLHLLGISTILKDILSGSSLVSNNSISPALTRPAEQIFEIMNLADELLPPLPEGTISLPVNLTFVKGSSVKKSSPCVVENPNDATNAIKNVITARERLIHDQPELLQQFGMDLLPVLIQIYTSSVNGTVRHKCLSVIAKLMYFSKADMIQSLLSVSNISSFLAGILAWKDPQVLVPALQIAEVLMEKLPGTFSKMFIREGVVHAVDMLILPNSSCASIQSSAEKDNDFLIGSSRSRRYRRRSGGLNPDVGSIEESKRSAQGALISSSGPVETPTSNSSLRVTVSTQAKTFKSKYFPSGPGVTEVGASEDLIHLKNLCAKLNAITEDVKQKCKGKSKASGSRSFSISPDTEKHLHEVICEIIKELNKDGLSTFEFICSGVVSSLLNYLSCGTFSKERVSEVNLPKLRDQAIKRYKSFLNVSLTKNEESMEIPMTVLVQKLQSALSSSERFPVVLSHSSRSITGSARLSSGLSVLSQPIKLCLCRARGAKSLRDYSSNVVLIDPFATLAAVEEFLWPRVVRGESGQKPSESAENSEHGATPADSGASLTTVSPPTGRRHSTRSRSALVLGDGSKNDPKEGHPNLSKGKGKAVLKSAINEETKGLQTRNLTRSKVASDKNEPDSRKIDTSSEDEDLEMSPVDVDDALIIEEEEISEDEDDDHDGILGDDSIPVCPDKVHDVKLGDAVDEGAVASSTSNNQTHLSSRSSNRTIIARDTDSDDFRTGNIFNSRGAMSFAAAAMAGLASGSGRGLRGSRDRRAIPRSGSSNDPPKLVFSSGGKPLNRQLTIYQAIQRQLNFDANDENERVNGSDFLAGDGTRPWGDIYTITYQKADAHQDQSSPGGSSSLLHKSSKSSAVSKPAIETQSQQMSLMDSILQGELPCDLEKTNSTYNILALLRVLECLNQLAPRLRFLAISDEFSAGRISNLDDVGTSAVKVPTEEFVNSKLTPKLTRQMQDALALCSGSLPSWCSQLTKACPFLFPFETRRQFFYSTAFGLSRALHRLQQQGAENHSSANEREIRVGRLQRQKVRVSRNQILDSAAKVMEMYSSNKAMLEVEYFGEVGTGLGPTLEFYTLLSHEFQKVPLQMWRCNSSKEESAMQIDIDEHLEFDRSDTAKKAKTRVDSTDDFVSTSLGLFPRPWPPNADSSQFKKVVEYFRLIGRVMAKALQDGRLLDIPLSMPFYKLFLGQELDLHDIYYFDAEFGKTLQEMQLLVDRKKFMEMLDSSNKDSICDLHFRGTSIEDLCLDFTLPGYPEYVLKEGEEDTIVDINNLDEYISLVVDATLKSGISRQMDAFREGFNQGFDITSLQIFSPDELDCLLCGRRELWETETLVDHIKFDHGYTAKSPAITNFLEIMNEFTPDQQRAFCQFVTGAPRLPPGGLAVLNPKLTIVRKLSSTATNIASNGVVVSELSDNDLPSVMTCANYLKLPPYSTKEIMLKKLLFAINEGQGSFDLS